MTFLLNITPWPVLSALLWIVLVVTALYFARPTAHKLVVATGNSLHKVFRTASKSVNAAEKILAERNREVLLAAGREAKERIVEREFDRINETVRKDLANYSALHRSLSESIDRIEQDHKDAVDVPPDPPGWVKAVEAVAKIDSREGRVGIGNVLSDIHKSLVKAHKEAMVMYHEASAKRHELLRKMRPEWREIQQNLNKVGKNVDSLLGRAVTIDRHMQEYEDIVKGENHAVSVLSSSSLVYFFVSALVLVVALGGATINFSLIARPMAEMVGGTNLIGGFKTADIAALVIIMVEISMGLFLMESLRITRLFPVIGALPDKTRVRMIWITFTMLFLLASVEAGLAFMREVLLHDELATSALLRGDGDVAVATGGEYMWITTAAQMGMGFILPFALTFVAIPLETFVHSLRTVVGLLAIGILRFVSLVLRLMGNAFRYLGVLFTQLYDLPLFIPLWWAAREAKPATPGSGSLSESRL
jgi:transcriptional regulator of heat shock response